MKLARLEQILAVYGTDPAGWPARETNAATNLLAQSAQAQCLLRDARQLETVLTRAAGREVPDASVQRIMDAAFARIDRLEAPARQTRRLWLMPAGFAFGSLLLFLAGVEFGATHSAAQDNQDTAAKLIIEGPYRSFASL